MNKNQMYKFLIGFTACSLLNAEASPKIITDYEGPQFPSGFLIAGHVRTLYGKNINYDVSAAWTRSLQAIDEVISEKWRSAVEVPMLLVPDEFDKIDVAHCNWEKNGYKIRVAQTATLMAITLTPVGNEGTEKNIETMLDETRKLCADFFVQDSYRWTGQMERVPINDLSGKIASYLFDSGIVYATTNKTETCLYGRGKTALEEGVLTDDPDALDTEDYIRFDQLAGEQWFKTPPAWQYWFRRIYWWNDGQSICFFFPKSHGGSAPAEGSAWLDKEWLNYEPSTANTNE